MKTLLGKIIGVVVVSTFLVVAVVYGKWGQGPKTAYAIGDLIIDWNVPAGNPIFVVNNFAPGDMATRPAEVTNSAAVPREVGVRGVETGGMGALSDVLGIAISADGVDVYGGASATGPKTVSQFFTDSTNPDGISLVTVNPSETVVLDFAVKFSEAAGNAWQNASVVLDITLGITGAGTEVPSECAAMSFAGDPIFGTDSGDVLRGTAGNDLIFGLEGGDAIYGNGGDDCLVGGPGGDYVNGRSGHDVLLGNAGGDSLVGEAGNDTMVGGTEGDSLNGGSGNDVARGGDGNDGLSGGDGNDGLFGESGVDSAIGGSGIDTCEAEGERSCEL